MSSQILPAARKKVPAKATYKKKQGGEAKDYQELVEKMDSVSLTEDKEKDQRFHFKESYFEANTKKFHWNLAEYKAQHKKYRTLTDDFSALGENADILSFVDFDIKYDTEEALPSEQDQEKAFDLLETAFRSMFSNPDVNVISAYKESGFASNIKENKELGKWKVSFRMWATNLKTTPAAFRKRVKGYMPDLSDIPAFVRNYDFQGSPFDT
ncbi:hypothetical protein HKX48_001552 [Thoreauomyces humboldtii]|nr:hypothetical protein HKX48_001552 [Thoreauomyces humboldtii]